MKALMMRYPELVGLATGMSDAVFRAIAALAFAPAEAKVYGGLLLGAGIGLVARGSARLLPSHGRALFALLAVVPELLRLSFADTPSLPSFYGFVLSQLADLGARLP